MGPFQETLQAACCEDIASCAVFVLNLLSFLVVVSGLMVYFNEYSFSEDHSDEVWIYTALWLVPCFAFVVAMVIHLATSFQFENLLWVFPVLAAIGIFLLLGLCFVFYQASSQTESTIICAGNEAAQDNECVETKTGIQICGHTGISQMCYELDVGFYCVFMGCIVMAGTLILLITTGCLQRSRLASIRKYKTYIKFRNQL